MIRYKAEVQNSPGWRNYSAATLDISPASPNCQGDKLAGILEFAASHFSTVRVNIADALYRHNYMAEGIPPAEASARANAMGALWLAQHTDLLEACPVKPQVVRWAEWHKHADYNNVVAGFQRAYDINFALREAVEHDVDGFYRRRSAKPSALAREHSKNFLLEEVAVICLQARELPSLRVYPGEQLMCLRAVSGGLVPEAPAGIEREQFARVKLDAKGRPKFHEKPPTMKAG